MLQNINLSTFQVGIFISSHFDSGYNNGAAYTSEIEGHTRRKDVTAN